MSCAFTENEYNSLHKQRREEVQKSFFLREITVGVSYCENFWNVSWSYLVEDLRLNREFALRMRRHLYRQMEFWWYRVYYVQYIFGRFFIRKGVREWKGIDDIE